MKTELDLKNWNRYEHFKFFSSFDEPFFGVTVNVDCTKTYKQAKENNTSFFLNYLHKSLKAANSIDAFKYRIEKDKVFLYDQVNASPTINRPNGTFGFSYMEYKESFEEFSRLAMLVMEKVRNSNSLIPAGEGQNVIHYSSLPWLNFTSVSHARHFKYMDSCPKISFGKMTPIEGVYKMPISIHVNHALVDGIHVGEFVDRFQALL